MDYCIPLHKESAPLAQLNYDHVDIQLHVSTRMDFALSSKIFDKQYVLGHSESKFKLKGWGI